MDRRHPREARALTHHQGKHVIKVISQQENFDGTFDGQCTVLPSRLRGIIILIQGIIILIKGQPQMIEVNGQS